MDTEEEKIRHATRFERLKQAVAAIAQRDDQSADDDGKYFFELQNQDGTKVDIPPKDRSLLIQGITCKHRSVLNWTEQKLV